MKIVINTTFGGFHPTQAAVDLYNKLASVPVDDYFDLQDDRTNLVLVHVVEELGELAGDLKVVEIPDDVKWHIGNYDGKEWVAEDHRTWS